MDSIMNNDTDIDSSRGSLQYNSSDLVHLMDNDKEITIQELYDYIRPDSLEWILITVYMVTWLVGVTGNILVCFSVWKNNDLRTVTNIFIVNLAVADLFIVIFLLPSILLVDVTATWFLGTVPCKLHLFLATLTISVSVMTLCAISVERWYAICHPLRFHSTASRARYIVLAIWVTSFCIALPEFITATVVPLRSDTVLFSSCYPALLGAEAVVIFQICLMIGLYFLPLAIMAFSYIRISFVLWRGRPEENVQIRTRHPMLSDSIRLHETSGQTESRRKAVKMLVAVVVMFALCFLPNHALNIIRYTGNLNDVPNKRMFGLFAHWATFLNSCINPVIYNFMSNSFRKAFQKAMRSCLRCRKRRQKVRRRQSGVLVTFTASKNISIRYSKNYVD